MREWERQRHWTDADYRMGELMSSYLANFVKNGDPNGDGLPNWPQPEAGPAFVRLVDGYSYAVDETPYPRRDAVNRAAVLKANDLTEADIRD
jgi:para-nitrobenzyl esterase